MYDELNTLDILNLSEEDKEKFMYETFRESFKDVQALLTIWSQTGTTILSPEYMPDIIRGLSLACFIYQKYLDENPEDIKLH